MPLRLSELRLLSPLKLWTTAAPEAPADAALEPPAATASAPAFGACAAPLVAEAPVAEGEDPPGDRKGTSRPRGCAPRAELTARRPATPAEDAPIRTADRKSTRLNSRH